MLFTINMNRIAKYLVRSLAVLVFLIGISSCTSESNGDFSEVVKVSLREVGHQLLLANQDSTSLVKPVVAIDELKYQLSFQQDISIDPDSLAALIKNSFQKADLPQDYLVEVIQCADQEVGYSYEMKQQVEKAIVPCGGRILPTACYMVTVRFTKAAVLAKDNSNYLYTLTAVVIFLFVYLLYRRITRSSFEAEDKNYSSLGRFKFYPEQNKLIKEATEIGLTRIECELLAIFVAQPNQIIKRDQLTKQVWEDNGVVVGRSLDTYISKLRKKLQDDDSIKITNIHGVGYKLEIN